MYNTDIVSRTTITNNIVSTNTNKQLQRSDFITPLIDQNVVNGYSFYVAKSFKFPRYGSHSLKNIIDNADINLASKLSGYTDKKFLKVLAEQVSPNAISENVIIPDEDYELVVTKTTPLYTHSTVVLLYKKQTVDLQSMVTIQLIPYLTLYQVDRVDV